jgi:hypothetical protein
MMMKKIGYTGFTMQDLAEMQSKRLKKKGDKYSTEDFLLAMRSVEGLLASACSNGAPPMLHVVGNDAVALAEAAQPLTLEEEQAASKAVQDLRSRQEKK